MPKTTQAAGTLTADDIHSDISHLSHLIGTVTNIVIEIPRGSDEGANADLDRVGSLLWVARDMAELSERNMAANIARFRSPKSQATSEIPALFREWSKQLELASDPQESKDADAAHDRMFALKALIMAIPAATLADFAMKVSVSSQGGNSQLDMAMIEEADRIATARADTITAAAASRLMGVEDKLTSARSLNEAIFLAAAGINDPTHMQAIQTVANIVNEKLGEVLAELQAIGEGV
ncbi:hypothetical protein [Rhizobium sp. HT1-10]|uniref:hypothetical protein n=1 Tax=Rhizobium sp. HT1-10 TaxID=3111638 RepID=UPI003C20DA89